MKTKPVKPIVIVPMATNDPDMTRLRDAGYVPIRSDDPSRIIMLTATPGVSPSDLLMCAMQGLDTAFDSCRSTAWKELHRRLKLAEESA